MLSVGPQARLVDRVSRSPLGSPGVRLALGETVKFALLAGLAAIGTLGGVVAGQSADRPAALRFLGPRRLADRPLGPGSLVSADHDGRVAGSRLDAARWASSSAARRAGRTAAARDPGRWPAFPAPMLFPPVTAAVDACCTSISISAASSLMLLGTQWYILFNVIAGASSIPGRSEEVASVYRWNRFQRWLRLYIPCVFPYLVTGLITAAGGAWNATIVAEYVQMKTTHLRGLRSGFADQPGDSPGQYSLSGGSRRDHGPGRRDHQPPVLETASTDWPKTLQPDNIENLVTVAQDPTT